MNEEQGGGGETHEKTLLKGSNYHLRRKFRIGEICIIFIEKHSNDFFQQQINIARI